MPTEFLTTGQLAMRLGVSVHTVEAWRRRGTGPRWVRLTDSKFARVRYRLDDVIAWETRSERPRAP
jgi:DNA-binding transcriptional regulator YiaG